MPFVDVTVDVTGARNSGGVIDVPHALPVLPEHRFLWRVSRSPASVIGHGAITAGVTSQTTPVFQSRHPRST